MLLIVKSEEEKAIEKTLLLVGGLLSLILSERNRGRVRFTRGHFFLDGRIIPTKQIRKEMNRLELRIGNELVSYLRMLELGKWDLKTWLDETKRLVYSLHIITGALAQGSIRTALHNPDIKKEVERQYGFLSRFSSELLAGTILGIVFLRPGEADIPGPNRLTVRRLRHRARSYSRSAYFTYVNTEMKIAKLLGRTEARRIPRAAESCRGCLRLAYIWMLIDDIPRIGTQECGPYCRCYFEYR